MIKNIFYLVGDAIRSTGKALDTIGSNMQGNYAYVEQLNRHSRIMPLRGKLAFIGQKTFIAPNSSVIGQVNVGEGSSLWYNTVLRGDVNTITVGKESIISDRTVVHASSSNGPKGEQPTIIGNRVYVGAGAILHACIVQDGANIGAGSIVYDGAVVEAGAQLEAGSLLTSGKKVPSGQIWGGSPARFIRNVSKEDTAVHNQQIDDNISLAALHEQNHSKSAKEHQMEFLDYQYGIEDDIKNPRNKYQEAK